MLVVGARRSSDASRLSVGLQPVVADSRSFLYVSHSDDPMVKELAQIPWLAPKPAAFPSAEGVGSFESM
jgi:hypothetical protein